MNTTCGECGFKLPVEEMDKHKGVCPDCKKNVNWYSEPEFFINE